MRVFVAAAVAALAGLAGTAVAQKGATVELGGMKATTPAGWKEEPQKPGSMRMHTFKLPKADGDPEDAELALFFFRGGSGTVEQNLARQVAKFQPGAGQAKVESKVEKVKVGTVDATYQDVSGTYIRKPFPMAEKGTPVPSYRQLYVVFETKDGQYYMTLLGPAKTIEKHKKAFEDWLKSFK
jgi:hypothetical protein